MSPSGIPVAPRVLQDLLLAKRACSVLGAAGESVELWETYALAQADGATLAKELDRMASLRGVGTTGAALQKRLSDVRGDTGPLVEYLRQALPVNLPLLENMAALDLASSSSCPPRRRATRSSAGSRT